MQVHFEWCCSSRVFPYLEYFSYSISFKRNVTFFYGTLTLKLNLHVINIRLVLNKYSVLC